MKKNGLDPLYDLREMTQEIENVIKRYLGLNERPSLALAMTLPPDYSVVHWVSNVDRESGITLFKETAKKMEQDHIFYAGGSLPGRH